MAENIKIYATDEYWDVDLFYEPNMEEDYVLIYLRTKYVDSKRGKEYIADTSVHLPLKDLGIDPEKMTIEECINTINQIPESEIIKKMKEAISNSDIEFEWIDEDW